MLGTYKEKAVFALRGFQVLCLGFLITGFIWSTSDLLLTTILVSAPVTPISVLMMLYGTLGSLLIEGIVRLLNKGRNRFLRNNQPKEESG